jgi:signal transduction histidine kinase
MTSGIRQRHRALITAIGMLWYFGAGAPVTLATERTATVPAATPPRPARNILLIHMVPRSTPALLALEQSFMSRLNVTASESFAFNSEYVDLAMFDQKQSFENELVAYLAAKYGRVKLDLVAITGIDSVRFMMRHRARLFPGVPIVFFSVVKRLVADVPLPEDVSGVWLSIDWRGTLEAARRLQPDLERAVVVIGASSVDRLVWGADARAQLDRLHPGVPITYIDDLSIEMVQERVAALPPRSVVLVGSFLRDASGRRFLPAEYVPLISGSSAVPVYGTSESHFGHGVVGGHLINFDLQGRQAAEIAVRMLRGERPPPVEGETLAYRFDARQLRRWGLDAQRLPPGSTIEFDSPSVWQTYSGYIAAACLLLAAQTWTIIVLVANRAQRRRAQEELAERLRFETLMSDLLAGQLTSPPAGADSEVRRALALIGADLDADRIMLAEQEGAAQSLRVTHAWTREGVPELPPSIMLGAFPWLTRRVAEGHVGVVSPLRPLPPEAATDRQSMLTNGARSLLALPLVVERRVVGVLTCATVGREREWPNALIERLQLLAEVFASTLARRRAETAARESEERFQQQRRDLTHALRVHTLGELSASLAHELNQPLSAILINTSALAALVNRNAGQKSTMSEALADIAADAKRAADIIDRLRALARKEHVPQRGLSVDALVDEVASLLNQDFVRRGIAVKRVAEPGLPMVTGDRIQLQQIFLNLLMNASEALEAVERGRRDITIVTRQPAAGLVEVAIRDSGIGNKTMDLDRMFERFVTTKPGGLGMGLAISRSIAMAHGGRVYAEANVDRGLTMYVELPADGSVLAPVSPHLKA